ncbi:putative methionyl-tRNA synthetase [Hordeum vulgare]|nr:putative methionyl-tRNA synthetase [Hordeum vulgare]
MEGSPGRCVADQPLTTDVALGFNYADPDVDMDEIITSGSVTTASHPEFDVQDETMDTTGDIDDELDDAEEEEGEEEAVVVEPEPGPKKKGGKRKRAANAKPAEPRVKWTSKEDECLAEAWKTVNINPITDANQNTDTYRGRIKTVFDEHKLVDPDFANIHMNRGEKAMPNRWSTIQTTCNKWHGIIVEVTARPESGANVEGRVWTKFVDPSSLRRVLCRQVLSAVCVDDSDVRHVSTNNEDQEFKFLHVISRIEVCKKWREVRLALDKAKETYSPDTPASAAVEGHPDGTKKARAARDAAPAAERLQASIEQCIADINSTAARREEKSDTGRSTLMINVFAKKMYIDLEFLMGAHTSTMDEKVKAWYIV